ncbi:reverse transcriptase [Gossypium australe]|uniref:Reverse transcriptase n=1 Tax=Gossypium australe TaxID=47621 RepID=A0A5B6VZ89_9ROSI|nr:reverse transcriptase [Gossypium australe]
METKLDSKRMEKVRRSCGFLNGVEVAAEGSRGGLCLAWKADIDVTLRSFSNWHLDVLVKEEGNQGNGDSRDWGIPRDNKRMELFRETLEGCNLMDIGFSGVWYTWERGNLPETNIRERLDRGVANAEWRNLFPLGSVQHLPYSTSDHCPLLITNDRSCRLSRDRYFRFEVWWTLEDSFEATLNELWESSSEPLMERLLTL